MLEFTGRILKFSGKILVDQILGSTKFHENISNFGQKTWTYGWTSINSTFSFTQTVRYISVHQ